MANYYQRFLDCVAKWPEKVAVEVQHPTGPDESYTYSELRDMSDGVAHWIIESGMHRGDRCAILAANGPRWLAVFMGVLAAGCIAVPLDTAFTPEQVRKLALDSGAKLLFADAKHIPVADIAVDGLGIQTVSLDAGSPHSLNSILSRAKDANIDKQRHIGLRIPAEVQLGDVAAILYSSGTTGDPKGVMLTHENLHAETDSILTAF